MHPDFFKQTELVMGMGKVSVFSFTGDYCFVEGRKLIGFKSSWWIFEGDLEIYWDRNFKIIKVLDD